MSLRNYKTIKQRRKHIEKVRSLDLKAIKVYLKKLDKDAIGNCENMIGAVSVPLGVAGPLNINGSIAKGQYIIPLATTEGALVASVNRGCKAIALAKGVKVASENIGMTRAPVFRVQGINEGLRFVDWVKKHRSQIKRICESTSSHLKLLGISSFMMGRNVYLRFNFDTCDAMGMNMVTFATERVVSEYITPKTRILCRSISGNVCVDKKPSQLNFILGRGKRVWGEVIISPEIVQKVLKTKVEDIVEVNERKNLYGSAISASLSFNAHYANILSAIFIATGQDVAHIAEGSLGITTTEIVNNNLYVSVYLPDLPVGVVGGGTKLPTQRESIELIGLKEKRKCFRVVEFAEVIAGAVLAGEISLLASLAQGSLATAHKRLARNMKESEK